MVFGKIDIRNEYFCSTILKCYHYVNVFSGILILESLRFSFQYSNVTNLCLSYENVQPFL